MKCEVFEERYDRLEEGAELPLVLALHLARCSKCAARVEFRRRAIELYRLPGSMVDPDLTGRVLAALPYLPRPRREVSLRNWVVSGFILVSSVILVPAQGVFSSVIDSYGPQWMVPFVLVFGLSVAIFGSLFIITHMNELSSRFGIPADRQSR